jgi:hypothetical protein
MRPIDVLHDTTEGKDISKSKNSNLTPIISEAEEQISDIQKALAQ